MFEYQVEVINRVGSVTLQQKLDKYSKAGWRLHSSFPAKIEASVDSGGGMPVIMIFEREAQEKDD